MIIVYKQDQNKAVTKWAYDHKRTDSSAEAIKDGIEQGKLKPGDLAVTVVVGDKRMLDSMHVIKHWAIYVLRDQIEAVPDRVGVLLKDTDWRYYREYMKFGRVKSAWYVIRKKKVYG